MTKWNLELLFEELELVVLELVVDYYFHQKSTFYQLHLMFLIVVVGDFVNELVIYYMFVEIYIVFVFGFGNFDY